MRVIVICVLLMIFTFSFGYSQVESKNAGLQGPLEFSADLVSRYVWRGMSLSATPNIQPAVSFSKGGFSAGAWGSYGVGAFYAETDLFVSYSTGSFTFTIFDYYVEDDTDLSANDYFGWGKSTTSHSLEGTVTFNGTENFPVSLTAATFLYGNDWDEQGRNYYSTYFEAAYSKDFGDVELTLFAGGTPSAGLYASRAAIVNIGFTLTRELSKTGGFSLPVFTSFIINPETRNVFMVFGVTL